MRQAERSQGLIGRRWAEFWQMRGLSDQVSGIGTRQSPHRWPAHGRSGCPRKSHQQAANKAGVRQTHLGPGVREPWRRGGRYEIVCVAFWVARSD